MNNGDLSLRRVNHPEEIQYIYDGLVENPGASATPVEMMTLARLIEDSQRSLYWLLVFKGEIVGSAMLINIDWVQRAAEYGIVIRDPERRRCGLGAAATAMVTRIAFENLSFKRIFARSGLYNPDLTKMAERLGWSREGTLRSARLHEGKWWDQALYAIIRE